jgi:isoquinoline 1-oxidoreductase subunit alpha
MLTLKINGKDTTTDAEPEMPLLWLLRGELKMTGSKFGCGMALCGACTVHVDGEPTRGCVTPIAAVVGKQVTTIEGLQGKEADAVRAAWLKVDVVQCGYCQGGQIMAAAALLKKNPKPSDTEIDTAMDGNLCRCGTYPRIRAAIAQAAATLA